jgi:hypothetical protein
VSRTSRPRPAEYRAAQAGEPLQVRRAPAGPLAPLRSSSLGGEKFSSLRRYGRSSADEPRLSCVSSTNGTELESRRFFGPTLRPVWTARDGRSGSVGSPLSATLVELLLRPCRHRRRRSTSGGSAPLLGNPSSGTTNHGHRAGRPLKTTTSTGRWPRRASPGHARLLERLGRQGHQRRAVPGSAFDRTWSHL